MNVYIVSCSKFTLPLGVYSTEADAENALAAFMKKIPSYDANYEVSEYIMNAPATFNPSSAVVG